MKASESKKELFENKPVTSAILTLAVPTIISQLISVIYNIADTFYVGRTGNPYMIGSVTVSLPLFLMTISFANLFGIGGGSMVARLMGAGREEKAKAVSSFGFYGALALSLIYSLAVFAFREPLLRFLGASENTMEYALQYTNWVVVLGTPFVVLSAVVSHLLRNAGYSKQAGWGLSGGGILNMLLDPLFMFVLFPEGQEVRAAAVATFISNVAAFLFLTAVLIRISRKAPLSLAPAEMKKLGRTDVKEVFSVGIPSAILPGLFDVANIVMNSCMAAHGDLELAAMGIVMKVERLPNAIGIGISQGMLPLVAYNYASGNHERMKKIISTARKMGLVCAFICVVIFELLAAPMCGIFLTGSDSAALETLTLAVTFLRFRCTASPFQFVNYHCSFCMQAIGDGKGTIIHAIGRILVFYVPLMYLFDAWFGTAGLALALPVGELLGDILALILLEKDLKNAKLS